MYAEVEQIQEEFKNVTFSEEENSVSEGRVERFIEEAGAEIDSYIGQVYQTPVSESAKCFPLLRSFCIAIVADRVRNILANKTARTEDEQDNGANTAKWAREQLALIRDSKLALEGADFLTAPLGVASNISKSTKLTFRQGIKQW